MTEMTRMTGVAKMIGMTGMTRMIENKTQTVVITIVSFCIFINLAFHTLYITLHDIST